MSRALLLSALLVLACGQNESDANTPAQTAGAGGSSTAGTSSGGKATGGSSGGSDADTGGAAGSDGGAASGGEGPSGSAGAPADALVDCDPRKILCKIAAPECPMMEVPSVEGTCYGPCVKIDRCACASAAACPEEEQYTCWGGMHCGPYVK
ncbi:MAG TPA: hypothetical protein VM686_38675 [Polyangiaceae bacterium]|nr:hypothetical protein [Polyangiaceae bacterium]